MRDIHNTKINARGITIGLPNNTSLMDGVATKQDRLYGYDTVDLDISVDDERWTITKVPHDRRPTADEIERRYDHSRHPNPLAEKNG